ncbi:efflux RND transporter permease subunit [bacterium]|nr:efflux RND transporter permease subunit [bacterium]
MDFNQLLQCGLLGLIILLFARRLPNFSLKRPIAFLMIIAFIVIAGLTAMKRLPLELMPNIAYGNVTIFVDVRGGMPPPEVERLITKPIEEAMGTVSKLKNIISTSKKHRAIVTLEFEPGTNMDLATLETREKFLRVKHRLPKEIEKPVIAHYEEADAPVVIAALTSPHHTSESLRRMVEETLEEKLLRVSGVANVEIGGGRQRKILVELDRQRLVALGLPFQKVVSVLERNNLNVRVGEVSAQSSTFGLRTLGDFKTIEDIKKIGVAVTETGGVIRLVDLGTVKDDYLEAESYSRLNSQAAVTLYIQKESLSNTVAVVEQVQKVLKKFEKTLTSDVEMLVVSNQGKLIKAALYSVMMTLFYGMTLVILILSLFLSKTVITRNLSAIGLTLLLGLLLVLTIIGVPLQKTIIVVIVMIAALFITALWRKDLWPAFIVAASIPVSLLLTLGFMYFNHVTLNVISLSGLVLGIGLLVDNAVVVLENYERLAKKKPGKLKEEQLNQATQEMINPMIGGTLTTIVVFLPFSLLQKQAQLLYAGIAFTVTTILLASLFSAIALVPALLNRYKSVSSEEGLDKRGDVTQAKKSRALIKKTWSFISSHRIYPALLTMIFLSAVFYFIAGYKLELSLYSALVITVLAAGLLMLVRYKLVLNSLLKHQGKVLSVVLLLFALSAAVFWYRVPKDFMASQEQNEFVVFIEMASGVRLDISNRLVKDIEERIQNHAGVKDEIKSISSKVEGWSSKIYVTLKPRFERKLSTARVIARLRKELVNIGEEYETFIYFSEPQSGKEVFVEVFGHNYETLAGLAMQLANRMSKIKGLSDTKVRYRPGRPEVKVILDRNKVALMGLDNKTVAESMHAQLKGLRATKFYDKQEEVETIVRLDPKQCETIEQLRQIMLMSEKDGHMPIEHIAKLHFGLSPSEIWHRNKSRMIQVSANLGKRPLGDAAEDIKAAIHAINFPDDYYADIGGDYEQMVAADKSFKLALGLTIILVFMVMAGLFESLIQPFIIMITVVLSGIGAVTALVLTHTTMTLGVSIGLLMLGGMVVNNGIILIDRINQLKAEHPDISLFKLISWAGKQRIRPIFITTVTTMCGLLPMALDQSESAGLWQPLAITVIGGLITGTVLTLFVVPCFYCAIESLRKISIIKRVPAENPACVKPEAN